MTSTCEYCGGEKSSHSQLCKFCYKTGAWQESSPMKDTLRRVYEIAQIKPHYINALLDHSDEFEKAFTSKSFDLVNNYEIYELLGDGIVNSFLSFYFFRRFPQLNCSSGVKVLARLKINYASKRSFANISQKLGFWPLIRAVDDEKTHSKESLLEDVLEAFIGLTTKLLDEEFAVGVGYGISYEILRSIFDDIDVSLEHEDLYDAKTRLKELVDVNPQLGTLKYEDDRENKITRLYRIQGKTKIFISEGVANHKSDREQIASKQALAILNKEGYVKPTSMNLFCE